MTAIEKCVYFDSGNGRTTGIKQAKSQPAAHILIMKSSVFRYPYPKVFRRTKGALLRLGMTIVQSDAVNGSINAVSKIGLFKPGYSINLVVEELTSGDTKVTITGLHIKKRFYMKQVDTENSEVEILGNLSINF